MRHSARTLFTLIFASMTLVAVAPTSARAQSYPIDCAILLCLSGGWPASVPCSRARAEFIRRVTPWPVEPPLQIWRCPMGASYNLDGGFHATPRIHDILFVSDGALPQSFPERPASPSKEVLTAIAQLIEAPRNGLPEGVAFLLAQNRADIDISGPEFNFVRSIRVFDVRYARQQESGQDGDCNRTAVVLVGTYGVQGDFSWSRTSLPALPDAHVGLERWGQNCPSIFHRSVFVDWRDYAGNYGFEQVNY